MKFRKPVAFLAAIMMLLSSSPAFAASTGDSHQTVIQARCLVPEVTIQVVVPTESQVYVNPQSLPVKLDGKISQSQILSEPARIENQTEVPLSVSATVSGTKMEGSDIILSSASTKDSTSTSKKAFIYFEMQAVDSKDEEITWDEAYNEDQHILVRTTSPKTKKDFLTLGASGKAGSFGAFRLAGDCIANPKTAWTATDGVNVTVSFTFKAVPNE